MTRRAKRAGQLSAASDGRADGMSVRAGTLVEEAVLQQADANVVPTRSDGQAPRTGRGPTLSEADL